MAYLFRCHLMGWGAFLEAIFLFLSGWFWEDGRVRGAMILTSTYFEAGGFVVFIGGLVGLVFTFFRKCEVEPQLRRFHKSGQVLQ